jgi:dihydrolipoamide dehydrogenase
MNYGCIPTKYLLHQTKFLQELKKNAQIDGPKAELRLNWKRAQDEKAKVVERLVKGTEFLLEKNGVELILGTGFLKNEREVRVDAAGAERGFEAQAIILATGSRAAHLPFLNPDGREVVTSREALEFTDIPRTMIVIGAGAIGIEIGSIYARMGTEVTILEIMPTILPGCDREIVTRLERLLKKQGLKVHTQMRIEEASVQGGRVVLRGTCLKGNVPFVVEGEKALLATGRRPYSDQFRSAGLPLSLAKGGHIEVDLYLETRIKNIFAVGDLIGGKLLAHKASHEGIIAAENACGGRKTVNYGALPMAVFTEPEFASVGLTEEDAREKLGSIQIGHFSLQASGRA